jgi:5-methyltetrahydrofolate--homocysteine methyltransferase
MPVSDFETLREAVLTGDAGAAVGATNAALAAGAEPLELVNAAIAPAMNEVGRRYEAGDYYVPELLMAARATKEVFAILRPRLARAGSQPRGRVVLGTVQGDLHDIGKNLVAAMLEGGGFEVIDLGVDVPAARIVAAVRDRQPDLLGLSALLTTTIPAMPAVIAALEKAGIRDSVKVIVGGAPVTQAFADGIGADGYAENAAAAVGLADRLVSMRALDQHVA